MKLRIRDNSLRLRLTQTEVRTFKETGKVKAVIQFVKNPPLQLTYQLQKADCETVDAGYEGDTIRVLVPENLSRQWTDTEMVGFGHQIDLGDGDFLTVLVEKDFQCLAVREEEDESDNFPNPKMK